MRVWLNLLLVAVFVLLRTAFDNQMRSLDIWVSYGIEALICAIFLIFNRKEIHHRFVISSTNRSLWSSSAPDRDRFQR